MADPNVEFDPDSDEPPLLEFLRDYWQGKRGARAMPGRQDIRPSDMKAQLPHILLADVIADGADFRYRLVGGELQRYFKSNPSGKLMSEALMPFGTETVRRTIETYATVVTRRAPLRIFGTGALYDQAAKYFDALLTPLSDDGVSVNMILGTFAFAWDVKAVKAMPGIMEPDEVALARALYGQK